jgi:hypothetical protein
LNLIKLLITPENQYEEENGEEGENSGPDVVQGIMKSHFEIR